MPMQRFIASQLRQPHGWFGSLVASRVMNRVNRQIIHATIAMLEILPEHHVLEIGFGMTAGFIHASRADLDKSFQQMNSRM